MRARFIIAAVSMLICTTPSHAQSLSNEMKALLTNYTAFLTAKTWCADKYIFNNDLIERIGNAIVIKRTKEVEKIIDDTRSEVSSLFSNAGASKGCEMFYKAMGRLDNVQFMMPK